jgi:hypothetical protein
MSSSGPEEQSIPYDSSSNNSEKKRVRLQKDKKVVTIRIEKRDYEYLQKWAMEEFLSVNQLVRYLVLKAIATNMKEKQ